MGVRGSVTVAVRRGRAVTLAAFVALGCLALAAGIGAALMLSPARASATGTVATPPVATPPASNPFAPGIPQPTVSTPVTPTPTVQTLSATTTGTDSGLSGGGIVAIAIGALVILGGIAFFIWYDARKRAPVRARAVAGAPGMPGTGKPGSKRAPKPRKLSKAEQRRRKRGRAR